LAGAIRAASAAYIDLVDDRFAQAGGLEATLRVRMNHANPFIHSPRPPAFCRHEISYLIKAFRK
jgi:hypothetical protein